jgi:hypothetical protein
MVIHKPETPEEHHQAFLAMHGQRGSSFTEPSPP